MASELKAASPDAAASATFIVEPEDELTYRFVRNVTTSPEEAGTGITVVGFLEDVP
jgi:hypothetical protein